VEFDVLTRNGSFVKLAAFDFPNDIALLICRDELLSFDGLTCTGKVVTRLCKDIHSDLARGRAQGGQLRLGRATMIITMPVSHARTPKVVGFGRRGASMPQAQIIAQWNNLHKGLGK
jgi:hypothetical protein